MKKYSLFLFIGFLFGCSAVVASNYMNKDIYKLNMNDAYALLRGNLTTQQEYYKAFEMIGYVKGVMLTTAYESKTDKEFACINKSPLVWEDIVFDKYKKGDLSSDALFCNEIIKEIRKCLGKK